MCDKQYMTEFMQSKFMSYFIMIAMYDKISYVHEENKLKNYQQRNPFRKINCNFLTKFEFIFLFQYKFKPFFLNFSNVYFILF